MHFQTHTLPDSLSPFVESIFHFKNFNPDHSKERVIPTGHLFLIFELDNMPRHTYDNVSLEPNATYSNSWLSGMHKHYITISAHPNSEMFVIQFKAYGAHPFVHRPIHELNDKVVPAETLFGDSVHGIREAFTKTEASEEKFSIAESWLHDRFKSDYSPPAHFIELAKQLQQHPAEKYTEIMAQYPNSQKHLIDQCKRFMGLTPKYYQRIMRFNEILQKIQKKEKITWTEIAYQCGFADQSHFIKEFNHFSGFNPEEFIEQSHHLDEPNFFPLDREG